MARLSQLLGRAAISGTVASVTSTAALTIAAKAERSGALQPVNATSHWLNGPGAAEMRSADLTHTAVGYATHHAATLMWALLFEGLVERHRSSSPAGLVRDAALTGAVAAAVDYMATPKRFTPGWEYVLSKRSMTLAYVALSAGLAAAAVAGSRNEGR